MRSPLATATTVLVMASAAGGALAQSSVQLNGVVDLYAGQKQFAGRAKTNVVDSGGMTTSRIAIEGTEDLGGGLKAIYGISGFLRADAGLQGRFNGDEGWRRYSFVGLQGSFGTLRMGRITTASFVHALRFNAFADSTTFGPYMLHLYTGGQPVAAPLNAPDSAADQSVAYQSPTVGGFSASAQYSFGEVAGQNGRNRWIVGANWSSGPLALSATAERSTVTAGLPSGVTRLQNMQLAGSYNFGPAKLTLAHSDSELSLAAGSRDLATWQVGTVIPAGSGWVLLSWARTTKDETAMADVTRDTLGIGYDYALSKRTDLYAVALEDKVTAMSRGHTLVVGVRHRF